MGKESFVNYFFFQRVGWTEQGRAACVRTVSQEYPIIEANEVERKDNVTSLFYHVLLSLQETGRTRANVLDRNPPDDCPFLMLLRL